MGGSESENQTSSTALVGSEEEEEACLFAMQLASASVLPMVLKSAIELDLLETMAKAGPGAFVSPTELAAQLPTQNPDAAVMLDRILRLLTSYAVLNCSVKSLPGGGVERLYALAPVCKYLTKNTDGVSMAPLLLMNQDKVLMESCVKSLPSGGVERLYALAPVCKYLTKNTDGVSMAPLLLMNQDKVLMESW